MVEEICAPCIAISFDGGKGDAAIEDLEEGLVGEIEVSCGPRGDGFRKSGYCIVVYDGTRAEEGE